MGRFYEIKLAHFWGQKKGQSVQNSRRTEKERGSGRGKNEEQKNVINHPWQLENIQHLPHCVHHYLIKHTKNMYEDNTYIHASIHYGRTYVRGYIVCIHKYTYKIFIYQFVQTWLQVQKWYMLRWQTQDIHAHARTRTHMHIECNETTKLVVCT